MESAANFPCPPANPAPAPACLPACLLVRMASALFFRRTIRSAAEIRDTCHPNSPPRRSYIVFFTCGSVKLALGIIDQTFLKVRYSRLIPGCFQFQHDLCLKVKHCPRIINLTCDRRMSERPLPSHFSFRLPCPFLCFAVLPFRERALPCPTSRPNRRTDGWTDE